MGHHGGSTLDLDFSKGMAFAEDVFRSCGKCIHPVDDTGHFIMVVSFSRHNFRLNDDSVAAALESAIGGSAIDLSVQLIKDKVFSFIVSCKRVGLLILQLRSFACPQFKCFFHLWGNGGPNWKREFLIWKKECDAEWILISPSKRRASLGLIAMHKPPSKSALRSGSGSKKKISFATFQQYNVCKGYSYPASPGMVDDVIHAGYTVLPRERVILPPPPVTDLRWTVAEPPITFGTVNVREISSAWFSVVAQTTLDVNLHVHGDELVEPAPILAQDASPAQSTDPVIPMPRLFPRPYQTWICLIYLHLVLATRRILICNQLPYLEFLLI